MVIRNVEDDVITYYDGAQAFAIINETETDDGILMTITGALRSDIANDLLDELIAFTTVGVNVIIDFEKVEYLSSTTQHVFLRVQQKMDSMGKGTLTLRKLPPNIFREFEKTGASELLMIEI